jgi:hypothetical protein
MDRTARECMQALPARGTNADAFLIMPVQRIPRCGGHCSAANRCNTTAQRRCNGVQRCDNASDANADRLRSFPR